MSVRLQEKEAPPASATPADGAPEENAAAAAPGPTLVERLQELVVDVEAVQKQMCQNPNDGQAHVAALRLLNVNLPPGLDAFQSAVADAQQADGGEVHLAVEMLEALDMQVELRDKVQQVQVHDGCDGCLRGPGMR